MKSKDHTNLEDKDLVHELLDEYAWFLGYEDEGFVPTREGEVFTPTRKELLVLFKHWYKAAQDLNYINCFGCGVRHTLIVDDIWRRVDLIAKFLPEEVLEAVSKQMDEEELERQAKELQDIPERIQVLSEKREVLVEAVNKQMDVEELELKAKELQDIERRIEDLSLVREVLEDIGGHQDASPERLF